MAHRPGPQIRCFGKNYEAILFDMDGTLVDSRSVIERIWKRWADDNDLDVADILAVSHGRRTIDTVTEFYRPGMDVDLEVLRLEKREAADNEGVLAVAGAREFIDTLLGSQWAVVTSAGRQLATSRLRRAGLPVPDILITAEDVTSGKPDPQGYLLAAKRLGMPISRCLVFEDAPAGIQAGLAAGCDVVAITAARPHPFEAKCPSIFDYSSIGLTGPLHAAKQRAAANPNAKPRK